MATALLSLGAVILAVVVDSAFNWHWMSGAELVRHILLIDILLPVLATGPVTYALMTQLRRLALAHEELQVIAATDSLTTVLNRGAFLTLVDGYLEQVEAERRRGALLVVDADNFKAVNDHYGHDRGDEALRLIAAAIKRMLRSVDLVGRIGGEEFGVFLPGATREQAETVAERIRVGVTSSLFEPGGARHELTVSIGGAVFERHLPFADLFRVADQQLYLAKAGGRNRVRVAPITGYGGVPMAAA